MDQRILEKLAREQALTVEEALALDTALEAQQDVARLVETLGEAQPSLAWRSRLNERLLACTPVPRKRPHWGWATGALASVAAVAILVAALPREQPHPSAKPAVASAQAAIEESLVNAHRETDLEAGMGVAWNETAVAETGS